MVGALTGGVLGSVGGGLVDGLFGVAVFGLIGALTCGGHACLQHVILRFFLWHAGLAPWKYVQFLEYAVERILLHRVGAGYLFIHRSLLEYFAKQDSASSPR